MRVGACQDKDAAGRHLKTDVMDQGQAVPPRHADIAQKEVRAKMSSESQTVICRIAGNGLKSASFEDDAQCIGNDLIVIYYQNPSRRGGHSLRSQFHA